MGNDIVDSSGSMVSQLVRAEIDLQISTAQQYPRSISKVNRSILSLVTVSQKSAEKCTYALPRGGKPITGPSIRLAEIVASQWGNCRIGARVVHVDRKEMFVEAEGIFHDLETNTATTSRVRRRISDKNGRLFKDDMILVTGNAACSIAKRNAILSGVPEAMWGEAYDTALRTMKGDAKTLPERKEAAMKAMAAFGMKPEDVWAVLGIHGDRDINLDHIVTIGGMHSALKNEETTVEELMNTIIVDVGAAKPAAKSKPAVKKKAESKPVTKAAEKPEPEAEEAEVVEEKAAAESGAGEEQQPDPAQFNSLYGMINNDLIQCGGDFDAVLDLYGDQIKQMEAAAPELHAKLMAEVEVLKAKAE